MTVSCSTVAHACSAVARQLIIAWTGLRFCVLLDLETQYPLRIGALRIGTLRKWWCRAPCNLYVALDLNAEYVMNPECFRSPPSNLLG